MWWPWGHTSLTLDWSDPVPRGHRCLLHPPWVYLLCGSHALCGNITLKKALFNFYTVTFLLAWKLDLCQLMCFLYKATCVFLPNLSGPPAFPASEMMSHWELVHRMVMTSFHSAPSFWLEVWFGMLDHSSRASPNGILVSLFLNACFRSMGWHLGGTQLLG